MKLNSMKLLTPSWKWITAIVSLVLTLLIWEKGLSDSTNRPSVTPKLSLVQQEMALVAYPTIPEVIKPFFFNGDPYLSLKERINSFPKDVLSDREKIASLMLNLETNRDLDILNSFDKDNFQINNLKSILN